MQVSNTMAPLSLRLNLNPSVLMLPIRYVPYMARHATKG